MTAQKREKEKQPRIRRGLKRELPPEGTLLKARFKREEYKAEVVRASLEPSRRAIRFKGREYKTMTEAAKAITGNNVNGWRFWKPID